MLNRPIPPVLLIAVFCSLAIVPFIFFGIPSGHDFEFHMFSWMDVLSQWKQGIFYPRWASLAHWGYGEARFVFYPPASWTLGAALGAILPWKIVPAAFCWLVLTFAGTAMYRASRQWLQPPDALFAAASYALNPYHLLIVYWRSAYAELLAAALLPLLLVEILRLEKGGHRATLWLSLILAAAWLTNLPAALMIHYSAAGLAFLLAVRARSLRPLFNTALAMLLGAGLASFFLVPAIYEQRWVNISEVLSLGVRPQDNFLFTTIADPDHNRFNLLVSYSALAEIVVLALAIWFSRRARSSNNTWVLLSVWSTATVFLMLSASNPLWQHLPKLRFVQLPFRWLLCMNAALAVLFAMATSLAPFSRWVVRSITAVALLMALVITGHYTQPPWWDTAADIREMREAISSGAGYEGTDEYVPVGADPYEVNKSLRPVSTESGAPLATKIVRWDAEDRSFVVQAPRPIRIVVRLFDYPAWKTTVNGAPVITERSDITGLLLVPLLAGRNEVEIRFIPTSDRQVATIVSLLSLGIFVSTWFVLPKEKSVILSEAESSRIRGPHQAWFWLGGVGSELSAESKDPYSTSSVAEKGKVESTMPPAPVLIATSNPGKLRDFAGAAAAHGVSIAAIPGFSSLPAVIEDGASFEANARKKAEAYSLAVPGELVLADDSGLEVDALHGAPGVHSARYAAEEPIPAEANSPDEANNARVLRELAAVPAAKRAARFVCVLTAARDGRTLATFRGAAEGVILEAPRGHNGFGYDPLFYFPKIGKTFAELSPAEKAQYSHRGQAFRLFLEWYANVNAPQSNRAQ